MFISYLFIHTPRKGEKKEERNHINTHVTMSRLCNVRAMIGAHKNSRSTLEEISGTREWNIKAMRALISASFALP